MLTYFCYTGKILVFLINFVIQGDFLVILTLNKRKYLKFCHTERSEVSIQKTESGLLNLWIFRYAQNDKGLKFFKNSKKIQKLQAKIQNFQTNLKSPQIFEKN